MTPPDRPIRVLIADDQRPTRMGLRLMIRQAPDLEVVGEAENGRAVLTTLDDCERRGEPLPDVVLMDVRMPVLDGIDATAAVVRGHPAVKVLILTTYDQDDYAFGALAAGASGFLLKDARTPQLHAALRAVAHGDAVLTPRITRQLLDRSPLRRPRSEAQRGARELIAALTPREREVAALVAEGCTNAEIAERLVLQPDSVKKTVTRMLHRLGLRDRVQVVIAWHDAMG